MSQIYLSPWSHLRKGLSRFGKSQSSSYKQWLGPRTDGTFRDVGRNVIINNAVRSLKSLGRLDLSVLYLHMVFQSSFRAIYSWTLKALNIGLHTLKLRYISLKHLLLFLVLMRDDPSSLSARWFNSWTFSSRWLTLLLRSSMRLTHWISLPRY